MFYSKSNSGFYSEAVHGARLVTIVTPGWEPPTIEVPDPNWVAEDHPGEPTPLVSVPDPEAIPPTVEVPNPDCKIPLDAVEITDEQWVLLLEGQTQGKLIVGDANGMPVLQDPPPPPVFVPNSATASQVIVWLGRYSNANGNYLTQVVNYVATLPLGHPVRTAWEREPIFKRDAQAFQGIAQLLGLTPEQVDAGLIEANLIEF